MPRKSFSTLSVDTMNLPNCCESIKAYKNRKLQFFHILCLMDTTAP